MWRVTDAIADPQEDLSIAVLALNHRFTRYAAPKLSGLEQFRISIEHIGFGLSEPWVLMRQKEAGIVTQIVGPGRNWHQKVETIWVSVVANDMKVFAVRIVGWTGWHQ
jgi:hypothetical protein